ncbi:addiction module toxin, HicA family [bacterium CPR1]|nr:addiction module toxin, HicA family [bacterium CPR1]
MSGKLPTCSGREIVAALERGGFSQVSQRGSHLKLSGPDGHKVIVPMHDEVARGTLSSILRQAGLTREELVKLLSQH